MNPGTAIHTPAPAQAPDLASRSITRYASRASRRSSDSITASRSPCSHQRRRGLVNSRPAGSRMLEAAASQPVDQLGSVRVADRDAAHSREHAQHPVPMSVNGTYTPGECERLGVGDQVREPQRQRGRVTENPIQRRMRVIQVEQGLVHAEHDDRLLGMSHLPGSSSVGGRGVSHRLREAALTARRKYRRWRLPGSAAGPSPATGSSRLALPGAGSCCNAKRGCPGRQAGGNDSGCDAGSDRVPGGPSELGPGGTLAMALSYLALLNIGEVGGGHAFQGHPG